MYDTWTRAGKIVMFDGENDKQKMSDAEYAEGVCGGRRGIRADSECACWPKRKNSITWRSEGRALGSAVEHRLHTAGVSGSNPLAPTNLRSPNATKLRLSSRSSQLVPYNRSPKSPRPGRNVLLRVELSVDDRRVDLDVGMRFLDERDPFRRRDNADDLDGGRSGLLQHVERRHRASSRRQHRIHQHDVA